MTFRLHSRLIVWTILIVILVTFLLSFFLSYSQLLSVLLAAIGLMLIFSYGVRVLVTNPLHDIAESLTYESDLCGVGMRHPDEYR